MATECAVVSTKVGGIPEVVGDAGILVEPRDSKQIASAVEKIANDRKLMARFKKRGRERTETIFDWDIIAKQFENSYRHYLEARK